MDGLPITQRYKEVADRFDTIPGDKLMAYLWGCNIGAITGARSKLRGMGYTITPQDTPNGRDGSMWVVEHRPGDQAIALQRDIEQLRNLLAEKENLLAKTKEGV